MDTACSAEEIMKRFAVLGLILLCVGCGKPQDDAQFSVNSDTDGVWLSYSSVNPFTITLWAKSDSRIFPQQHNSGQGKIRIFKDKGAIWLSEDGQGYGCFAPVAVASLLPAQQMKQTNPNVFPVGIFTPKGTNAQFVYLTIDAEKQTQ